MLLHQTFAPVDPVLFNTALEALTQLETQLPVYNNVSTANALYLPRSNTHTLCIVRKYAALAAQQPNYLPRHFNLAEMESHIALYQQLLPLQQSVQGVLGKIDNTLHGLSAKSYDAALVVYSSMRGSSPATINLDDWSTLYTHATPLQPADRRRWLERQV